MSDNTVTLTGNTTREPEVRFTANGASVTSFGLAVNRRWFNKSLNDWEEETSFFDVTAWGDLGQNAAETLSKGTRTTVTGRLSQRTWETQDGSKRSKVEVIADEIAVSLRWATAEVHRNERTDNNGPRRESKAKTTRARNESPAPNEEPF